MTGFFNLKTWGATFIGALATFGIATAMEIKTAPSGNIYVNPANARRGYYDLMAQTIIFHNDETGAVTLTALQLDLLGGPGEILSKTGQSKVLSPQPRNSAAWRRKALGFS